MSDNHLAMRQPGSTTRGSHDAADSDLHLGSRGLALPAADACFFGVWGLLVIGQRRSGHPSFAQTSESSLVSFVSLISVGACTLDCRTEECGR